VSAFSGAFRTSVIQEISPLALPAKESSPV
jgi:hypothetical protein